jgi:hypothetical protein
LLTPSTRFALDVPAGHVAEISTCGSDLEFDTRLSYGMDGACTQCLGHDDDGCPAGGGHSKLVIQPRTDDLSYVVLLGGYSSAGVGSYQISFSCYGGCDASVPCILVCS